MDSKWLAKVVERLDPLDQSPDFGRVTIRKSRSDAGKFDVLGVAPFRIPLYRYTLSRIPFTLLHQTDRLI
jgi:hypothetical protein